MKCLLLNSLFLVLFIQCKNKEHIPHIDTNLSGDEINQVDSNGIWQGTWVHIRNSSHARSRVYQIGEYVDDNRQGLWRIIFGKALLVEASFKEDQLDGDVFIYKKRRIKYQMSFCKGKLNGYSRVFSKKGKLIGVYLYQDGVLKNTRCYYNNDCEVTDIGKVIPIFNSG